jgi:hypothetical protein
MREKISLKSNCGSVLRKPPLFRAAHFVDQTRGGNERLAWYTTEIQTIASHFVALDEGDAPAQSRRGGGGHQSGSAGTDDDSVIDAFAFRGSCHRRQEELLEKIEDVDLVIAPMRALIAYFASTALPSPVLSKSPLNTKGVRDIGLVFVDLKFVKIMLPVLVNYGLGRILKTDSSSRENDAASLCRFAGLLGDCVSSLKFQPQDLSGKKIPQLPTRVHAPESLRAHRTCSVGHDQLSDSRFGEKSNAGRHFGCRKAFVKMDASLARRQHALC